MSAWMLLIPFIVGFAAFVVVEGYKARKAKAKGEKESGLPSASPLKGGTIVSDKEILKRWMGYSDAEIEEVKKRQIEAQKEQVGVAWHKLQIGEITKEQYDAKLKGAGREIPLDSPGEAARQAAVAARSRKEAEVAADAATGWPSLDAALNLAKGENVAVFTAQQKPRSCEGVLPGTVEDKLKERWQVPTAEDDGGWHPVRPASEADKLRAAEDKLRAAFSGIDAVLQISRELPRPPSETAELKEEDFLVTSENWAKAKSGLKPTGIGTPDKDGYFVPEMGNVTLRILPPLPGQQFFAANRLHYLGNGQPAVGCGKHKLVGARWEGDCPICDHYNFLWKQSDELAQKGESQAVYNLQHEARSLKPTERYYYNIIVRGHKSFVSLNTAQPKVLSVGKLLHKQIIGAIVGDNSPDSPPLGDITSPFAGRDFVLSKTMVSAGPNQFPEYKSRFLEPSVLGTIGEVCQMMDNAYWLQSIPDNSRKSFSELADIVRSVVRRNDIIADAEAKIAEAHKIQIAAQESLRTQMLQRAGRPEYKPENLF